jgi:hypothetical protein
LYKIKVLVLIFIFGSLNGQRIYINSIAKSGTHLLANCISQLTKHPIVNTKKENAAGDVITSNNLPELNDHSILLFHVPYSYKAYEVLKNNNFKGLFIYRDPRDRIISFAFWWLERPHVLETIIKINNFEELINKLIYRVKEI